MSMMYFAIGRDGAKRALSATTAAEAHESLNAGEIVCGERHGATIEDVRYHAGAIVRYRSLHRAVLARIRKLALAGNRGRSIALALDDARSYRNMIAANRASLQRALQQVAQTTCCEATCPECLGGAA